MRRTASIVGGCLLAWPAVASAETLTVPSCELAAVQSAVDSAVNGDTVQIPAGDCTWDDALGWSNKSIAVIGAGMDATTITTAGGGLHITATTDASFRVSGLTFTGSPPGHPAIINIASNGSPTPVKGWRIDHVRLSYLEENGITGAYITGMSWGLFDNCVFEGTGYVTIESASYVDADGWPPGPSGLGGTSWEWPLGLGTDEAIYVEDCVFDFTSDSISAINDQVYGARQVFRHNTINHAFFQTHATRGDDRGGLKYEIYSNTFNGSGFIWPALIRSGTGVIFDNQVSGYQNDSFVVDNQRTCIDYEGLFPRCDGGASIDGNVAGELGWPCLDQIGRAPGPIGAQPSAPLHAWNNGESEVVVNGDFDLCLDGQPKLDTHIKASPHSNGEVDFVNGSAPTGYTPFVYPHPLRGEEPIGGEGGGGSGGAGADAEGGATAGGNAPGPGDEAATEDEGSSAAGCDCSANGQPTSNLGLGLLLTALAVALRRAQKKDRGPRVSAQPDTQSSSSR